MLRVALLLFILPETMDEEVGTAEDPPVGIPLVPEYPVEVEVILAALVAVNE